MMKNEFVTKDFYSSCILRTLNFELVRVDKGSGKYSEFVFSDPAGEAKDIIERYWKRELPVQAKDLIAAIHDMKTILYQS